MNKAYIKKLFPKATDIYKYDEDQEDMLDGTDYTKVESWGFTIPVNVYDEDYDAEIVLNIYDDKDFQFFIDSAPIAVSLHTASQKRVIQQTMNDHPLPISKLDAKIAKEIEAAAMDMFESVKEGKQGQRTMKHVMLFEQFIVSLNENNFKSSAGVEVSLADIKKKGKDVIANAAYKFNTSDEVTQFEDGELENLDLEVVDWAEGEGIIPSKNYGIRFVDITVNGLTVKGKLTFKFGEGL